MSLKIVVVVLILALSVSVCWIMLYGSNPYVMPLPAVSIGAHGEIKDSLKYNQGTEIQVVLPALQGRMVLAVPSRFLYLVQTESCLPGLLKSVEAFGDLLACQCDVLVLSYKEVCNDSALLNVEYLFNSFTTWASGRNLLFEASMSRSEKVLIWHFRGLFPRLQQSGNYSFLSSNHSSIPFRFQTAQETKLVLAAFSG